MLQGIVVAEVQLGCAADVHAPADLRAEEASRGAESLGSAGALLIAAHDAVEDLGVIQVGAHLDCSDGDDANARIADLALQQRCQLAADLLIDACDSFLCHPSLPSGPGTLLPLWPCAVCPSPEYPGRIRERPRSSRGRRLSAQQ